MAVEGSLDLFSLPEILQMISQQGKTGILTVQGQQDIVAVSFLLGRIVAADSLAHTVEDGLSQVLVSESLLTVAEFARASAENQAIGGRLLDLLVERHYLTRQQLLAALRLQTIRQLEALLRWKQGDFKFYGGDEVSYEEGFQAISVEDLLLRTLAEYSDVGQATPAAVPIALAPATGSRISTSQNSSQPAAAQAAATAKIAGRSALSGGATSPRRTGAGKSESGELRLADVPELPDPASIGMAPTYPPFTPAVPRPGPGEPRTDAIVAAAPAQLTRASIIAAAASSAAPASPGAAPVPWPAAVMGPPPGSAAPPPRPRLAGAAAARPPGLPAGGASTSPFGAAAEPVVPPDRPALPKQYRQMQIERPAVSLAQRLIVAGLALGLAGMLVAVVRLAPETLLLPFPWEQQERNAFVRNQRESLFNKIEGAAKTAFLRDGRFPDGLSQLRDSGLLAPADLEDPRGEPLLYTAREDSYALQATESGKPLADAEASESIAGNFFLDPTLVQSTSATGPPIVLLD